VCCFDCCSCGVLESSTILFHKRVILVIYVINIHDIWLSVNTLVHMCGTIDPGRTYDEYLILLAKSGMTEVVLELRQL
jgi:hypothetical protein